MSQLSLTWEQTCLIETVLEINFFCGLEYKVQQKNDVFCSRVHQEDVL